MTATVDLRKEAADNAPVVLEAATSAPAPTMVVHHEPLAVAPPKRRVSNVRSTDIYALIGSAVAAIALTSLVFTYIAPFSGALGFVAVAYPLWLAIYAATVWLDGDLPMVADRIAAAVITSLAAVLFSALAYVVGYVLFKGLAAFINAEWFSNPFGDNGVPLIRTNFFTQDMSNAGPLDPLSIGGIFHAIVGTLIMITIALIIVVPVGISCAVYMNEIPGRFSRFVRIVVEAMTALPSIIAGLFVLAFWVLFFGFPKGGFAAALAVSVMMLPIVIRASDVVLRLVPGTLKEASYALGASQWKTVWHVVLPTARSGLTTAVILGTARGIGETSPVLLVAGFGASLNVNPMTGPMVSLPLQTFFFAKSSEANYQIRGFGTAFTLMVLVLILFVIARLIGGRGPGQLTARQRRARATGSLKDLERFEEAAASRATGGTEYAVKASDYSQSGTSQTYSPTGHLPEGRES